MVLVQKLALRILAAIFVTTCLLFILWLAGGKKIVENIVHDRSQPWATFRVPDDAIPLEGLHARLEAGVVTICNSGWREWSHVLVQIDRGYLAALDHLKNGECKQIPIHDFATESWKRMPPPHDLTVTRVAVLAAVARNSYAEQQLVT